MEHMFSSPYKINKKAGDYMDFGLALSGGGTRGSAHLGVLKALEENKLLPTSVSGASAGSVVAALISLGYSTDNMEMIADYLSAKGKRVIDPDILGLIFAVFKMLIKSDAAPTGILKGKKMENYFKKLMGEKLIKEVNIPLVIPAVDIVSGKTIAFTNHILNKPTVINTEWVSNARLYEIVRASCSIPGIFAPKSIGSMVLVDGGLTNNLPVDLLTACGTKKVIGVDISSQYEPPQYINMIETLTASLKIIQITLRDNLSTSEVLLLTPPLPKYSGAFCFSCMRESMEIGYDYAMKNMGKIRFVLET